MLHKNLREEVLRGSVDQMGYNMTEVSRANLALLETLMTIPVQVERAKEAAEDHEGLTRRSTPQFGPN